MNLQTIFEKFSIMSNAESNDYSTWISICQESLDELKSKLRKDVDTENSSNSRRLETAVATLALYKYSLYNSTSNTSMENFAAGEVKIKTNYSATIKAAYQAWQQAKSYISDLLIDDTFVFERIAY